MTAVEVAGKIGQDRSMKEVSIEIGFGVYVIIQVPTQSHMKRACCEV